MIIDAHVHIFRNLDGYSADGPTRSLPWGKVQSGQCTIQLMPPLLEHTAHTADMLIAQMDWAGVDKAVLLQGPFYGDMNAEVALALRTYPERLAGLAYLDPWTDTAKQQFTRIVSENLFCGIKLECSCSTGLLARHPHARLDDPDIAWLWAAMSRRELVLTLDLGAIGSLSYQTAEVRHIAETYPDLQIVIAHMGQPAPDLRNRPERMELWIRQLALGELANVSFDTSSLPNYFLNEGYPYPTAGDYIREAVSRIGSSKLLWATDIPGLLTAANYLQLKQLLDVHGPVLPEAERGAVAGANAHRIYFKKTID